MKNWMTGAVVACALTCYDDPSRWVAPPAQTAAVTISCDPGQLRCTSDLERCVGGGDINQWEVVESCTAAESVCSLSLEACVPCLPNSQACDGATVLRCDEDGQNQVPIDECDLEASIACRGGTCVNLCAQARDEKSNVGCEYWAVDLDNVVTSGLNAAAQQFAIVVSNPQPDLSVEIVITQDDGQPGDAPQPVEVIRSEIAPLSLGVFPLGPREVDGSPPGQYNTGTHTALTRAAYKLVSSAPVVAFQFNPLENVNVFSNDASLLKPVEALGNASDAPQDAYVVLGWPQTISRTDDPNTNFSGSQPQDFRSFLTIAATRDNTQVRVTTTARVIGGGAIDELMPGETLDVTLNAHDVLNLETDDFNADFTGSLVAATQPVAVFSGGEASDAPKFNRVSERRCCADHLEEQLDPIRTAGTRFVAPVSFNRHLALRTAGAVIDLRPESEVFRLLAVSLKGATILTSLEPPLDRIQLATRGSMAEIVTSQDFWIQSDEPITVGNVTPSQSAAQIPSNLPGGDPSFIIIPPIEQYRSEYVFLTPDRYSFDSLRIIAPQNATIQLDGRALEDVPGCHLDSRGLLEQALDDEEFGYVVYRCLLSIPVIDPALDAETTLGVGQQDDGVHQLRSDYPVSVIVDGFDRNVSYGYAAGTQLREISIF